MTSDKKFYIFVYGTMKNGMRNHDRLKHAEFVGKFDSYYAAYDMYCKRTSFGYFAPVTFPGNCIIRGELYKIDENTLSVLDIFEGHPNIYRRTKIKLKGFHEEVFFYQNGTNSLKGLTKNCLYKRDNTIFFDGNKCKDIV